MSRKRFGGNGSEPNSKQESRTTYRHLELLQPVSEFHVPSSFEASSRWRTPPNRTIRVSGDPVPMDAWKRSGIASNYRSVITIFNAINLIWSDYRTMPLGLSGYSGARASSLRATLMDPFTR